MQAIAIGNGTASRETDALVRQFLKQEALDGVFSITVSESGASVYSASEIARQEFPDLDLTVRGAISIARRLQDPLAELVKIDPKAIGVGQYQHDVDQRQLQRSLETAIESCVNRVGVDLNTASWALLRYVAGINERAAQKIVEYRNQNGSFRSRVQLTAVSGHRAEDLRAGGRFSAHSRRRQSAGHDGGSPGVLSGSRADRRLAGRLHRGRDQAAGITGQGRVVRAFPPGSTR